MVANRRFVQLPHPGGERSRRKGQMWSRARDGHARKFMQFRGAWVEDDQGERCGTLRAWGEWEPESTLVRELDQCGDKRRYPRYLWRPHYAPPKSYRGLHNTDPFIFGERPIYSNCSQPRRKGQSAEGLKHLGKGSVIVFGSGKMIKGKRAWVLDTVFVVADYVDYCAETLESDLAHHDVPRTFMDVTGRPLIDNTRPGRTLRLYFGATPKQSVRGMYSFFPASLGEGPAGFPRPTITLPPEYGDYFNEGNWRGPKGHGFNLRDLGEDELFELWECLRRQVRSAGLLVGTRAELPQPQERRQRTRSRRRVALPADCQSKCEKGEQGGAC